MLFAIFTELLTCDAGHRSICKFEFVDGRRDVVALWRIVLWSSLKPSESESGRLLHILVEFQNLLFYETLLFLIVQGLCKIKCPLYWLLLIEKANNYWWTSFLVLDSLSSINFLGWTGDFEFAIQIILLLTIVSWCESVKLWSSERVLLDWACF